MQERRELTARAVLAGLLVGALLAAANLYLGLAVGLWDSGSITAAVLTFALLSVVRDAGPLETNIAMTAAVATGAMPAVAGFLGAIPALGLLGGARPAWWALAAWAAALGALGVGLALLLRARLIEREQLPFPTGLATFEVIEAMHAGTRSLARARTLAVAALLAAVVAWFRDGKPQLLPAQLVLPVASALGIGVSISPLLFGVGALVGASTALSLLFGSACAWLALGPALLSHEVAVGPWLVWPGVGLLVGAAAVSLLQQAGAFAGAARDLLAARGSPRIFALAGLAAAVALAAAWQLFGLNPLFGALALLLSVLLGAVCGRAAGQTDVSPVSQMGQLTQAIFGPATHGRVAANLGVGALAGDVAQVGPTLWSLKTGFLLGASPRAQAIAALWGTLAGALISAPMYALLAGAYGVPGPRLPAPSALQFKAIAEVVAGSAQALPPGAAVAALTAFVVGAALALAAPKLGARAPQPMAMGIGFLLPFHAGVAVAAGALLWAALGRRVKGWDGAVSAAGLVAGESVAGLVVALLSTAGLL